MIAGYEGEPSIIKFANSASQENTNRYFTLEGMFEAFFAARSASGEERMANSEEFVERSFRIRTDVAEFW